MALCAAVGRQGAGGQPLAGGVSGGFDSTVGTDEY